MENKPLVQLGPVKPFWKSIMFVLSCIMFSSLIATLIVAGFSRFLPESSMHSFLTSTSETTTLQTKIIIYAIFSTSVLLSLILFNLKLKPPKFDYWVRDIANKRLSCTYIFYTRKYLFLEYDVALKKKDVMDFLTEINDKSQQYSYYLNEININQYVVSVEVYKKQAIPKKCSIAVAEDDTWNFIPLGEATNHVTRKVSSIGWYLNDNKVKEEMVITLPSTSLVVAGGTGSGKSVLENCIIGHVSRHSSNIQGLLVDVKKVEFGGLESYKGIKKVGLTVVECAEILTQARAIMYDRFTFMEQQGVNNVYLVKNKVDWYEVKANNQKYQFDEIFNCIIDGTTKLLTIDKIYEEIVKDLKVEIKDTESNNMISLTINDIIKYSDDFKPKAILTLVDELSEVMNDTNYKLVSSIQTDLGSIARLGRAAGCHLCLATQRPSSNVINADLKNNIQMGCLLGDFDSGAATLIFDKDISDLSKPEIKGRGFIKSGKDIVEFQSYWTEKEKDFCLKGHELKLEDKEKSVKKVKNKTKDKKLKGKKVKNKKETKNEPESAINLDDDEDRKKLIEDLNLKEIIDNEKEDLNIGINEEQIMDLALNSKEETQLKAIELTNEDNSMVNIKEKPIVDNAKIKLKLNKKNIDNVIEPDNKKRTIKLNRGV